MTYKTEPMNPVVKAKWLEALRGGEYRQTDGVLRSSSDGYCCLGVLSQLAADEGVIPQPAQPPYGAYRYSAFEGNVINGNNMYLIPKVMEWAGLDSNSGSITTDDSYVSLSSLNDGGTPFTEIADIIEKQL